MKQKISNPREIAYLALLDSLRDEGFISDILRQWREETSPNPKDAQLAQEIANGSARMALALDYLAEQATSQKKLNVKLKERALLRTAIYQIHFLSRVPAYAVVDETIKIAHQYCHSTFVKFLNAALRKISDEKPKLPTGNSISDLSIRYSFPSFFIKELVESYGLEKTKSILETSNTTPPIMMRIRGKTSDWPLIKPAPFPVAILENPTQISEISRSPDYYIQNVTPVSLLTHLQTSHTPSTILDLCASPGGKTLLAHDLFPKAQLFANDISPRKVETLAENFQKYQIPVHLSCSLGEEYQSSERFDLIILDVPCSNTGVLNKRAEARWRLTPENLAALEETQLRLIQHALSLLAPQGEIWFLTCSILPRENEKLMQKVCEKFSLSIRTEKTILPNLEGWDGGYCCALAKSAMSIIR